MLLSGLVVAVCLGTVVSQYQYHPYNQHRDSHYYNYHQQQTNNNRRHFQRSFSYPSVPVQRSESSSHLSSPAYRYQPRPVRTNKHLRVPVKYGYDRHPILIQPSQQNKLLRRPLQVPANNVRTTRKIELTPTSLSVKKYSSPHDGKKHKTKFLIKNDNLAVESQVVETKVKVAPGGSQFPQLFTSAHKPKPQPVKSSQNSVKPAVAKAKVPVNRNYNNVPQAPKFIIQQAGPSQQFGWVGHGHYAPLNVPNIFKAAGLNTRWIPGQDPVFEVGFLYPSPPSHSPPPPPPAPAPRPPSPPSPPVYSGPASVKVKKSIPKTEYSGYKQTTRLELPARAPPYSGTPPATSTPPSTTTTTTATTTTTRRTLRYSPVSPYSYSPTPPSSQYNSDYVRPSTYKPTFVSSTSKPFSVFIGSSQQPPRTVRPKQKEEEEVFYIFYENDDKPLEPIRTGVDLEKYIEREIENVKKDSVFSTQNGGKRKANRARVKNPQRPHLIDVPVKIEENGEGFTPPSKIRKVFVPHENSESIPEVFDVSVGTSFGYNKPRNPVFSFPSSSYNNPVTSYEAPIVAADIAKLLKPVKKVKKVKKERLTDEDQLSSLPFGTRLDVRVGSDIIKK